MAHHKSVRVQSIYTSTTFSVSYSLLLLTSGIIYIVIQWTNTSEIRDSVFISMLIGATILLLIGLKYQSLYLQNKGKDFYSFVIATDNPEKALKDHQSFFSSTMNTRRMTISGIIYGAAIGSSPFLLNLWEPFVYNKIFLSLFLFIVNFITGLAFYSLIMFYFHSFKLGDMIKVDLWNVDNPSTRFLLGATRRISVLSSFYVSICLSSILFSVFPISSLVITYSIFACLILLSSLIIPSYPVFHKLKAAKEKNLSEIDTKLNELFYKTINEVKSGGSNFDLKQFEILFQLRDRIESVTILPFKSRTLSAGLSIIVVSIIPVIVQIILERFVI